MLPHVLHAEIRIAVFACDLHLQTLLLHHLLLASHFRVFGPDLLQKLVRRVAQRSFDQWFRRNLGRTRRTVQQLYQLGLLRIHELVMMRDLAQQLGSFELSFQDILLAAFANPIAPVRDFLDLFKKLAVAVENLQGLLDVSDLKVSFLHLLKNGAPDGFELLPADRGILLGGFALELQLSRIRQVLRDPESDVGEIAVAESGKRSRTANRNVLNA